MASSAVIITPPRSQEDRNRELAIHHATLLQQRKDTGASILAALEELIEFPTDASSIAKSPALQELSRFEQLVTPFQVSDYNSLIEERNLAGKCGYIFCPNTLKRNGSSGKYSRILRGNKDQDLQIVPNGRAEMWCSQFCARAAGYIKLQLTDVPAWERAAGASIKIRLLSDRKDGGPDQKMVSSNSERKNSSEARQILEELALERGEKLDWAGSRIQIPLRERIVDVDSVPTEPTPVGDDSIEGYRPQQTWLPAQGATRLRNGQPIISKIMNVDDDKNEDQDWDLA